MVFANNPISGLLMLVGLFLADVFVGLVAVYTSAVAVLVAAYSGQDKALVQVMLKLMTMPMLMLMLTSMFILPPTQVRRC